MTLDEVLRHLCGTVGAVYDAHGDYTHASDCFCGENPNGKKYFCHSGKTLEYVRQAVVEKLERDGFSTPNFTQE